MAEERAKTAESDKRRETRYGARIVARVVRRGGNVDLMTNDVSFRGAFLRTDTPPALRQLVRVAFTLPGGEIVSGHAMVVHVVPPGPDGVVPGMGVQFWGPVQGAKAWEQYVFKLKMQEKAGLSSSRVTDKVRRTSERFKLSLDVVIDGKRLSTRDVSENGMAIRSESAMPVGVRATLQIHTPDGAAPIAVDIIVRRRIDEPDFRGLGVEYTDISNATRNAILSLLRAHAPESDKAIFVEHDDPELH